MNLLQSVQPCRPCNQFCLERVRCTVFAALCCKGQTTHLHYMKPTGRKPFQTDIDPRGSCRSRTVANICSHGERLSNPLGQKVESADDTRVQTASYCQVSDAV